MAKKSKSQNPFTGRWRIVSMSAGKRGDGAILRLHLPRAAPTAQAGLQPQSLGCLAGPRLVTEWAAVNPLYHDASVAG
jgi:hypothetical protein